MIDEPGKQVIAAVLIISINAFQQNPMVVGRNPVGIYLQVRMDQGTAGRRQVILGDGHVDGLRIMFDDPGQIPAAV